MRREMCALFQDATTYDWEGDSVLPLGYLLRNPDGSIRR